MYKHKLTQFYLITAVLLVVTQILQTAVASELADQIKQCAKEIVSIKRLGCYDKLAEKFQLDSDPNFIQPSREFLSSKLTVTPWHDEYLLSVKDFVDMINTAVMDNGEKIVIHGWTKQGHDYVLNITMRQPLKVKFLPFETATDEIPLSLLRNIVIDGETSDPELFITTIASMTPDGKNRKPR